MTPASHHGQTTKVRYYQCINCAKNGAALCSVKRVNVDKLHDVVIGEIARCAAHPTRLSLHIQEAVRHLPVSDSLREELSRLARNEREAERKIRANVAAIETAGGEGSGLLALTRRLKELETHKAEIGTRRAEVQKQLMEMSGRRPDAKKISEAWSRFGEIWNVLTEPEREELLPNIADVVIMEAKGKGRIRLILDSALDKLRHFDGFGCGSFRSYEIANRTTNGKFLF